jgi:hypothetical protein
MLKLASVSGLRLWVVLQVGDRDRICTGYELPWFWAAIGLGELVGRAAGGFTTKNRNRNEARFFDRTEGSPVF